MTRNLAGVYTLPPVFEAEAGQTIYAEQHNAPLLDIEADLNTARPISAGGTGGTTKTTAASALEVVSFGVAQTLLDAQKTQATANIGAVTYGTAQTLTEGQKLQAITNIGLEGLSETLSAISSQISASDSLTDIEQIIAEPVQKNVANPDIADAPSGTDVAPAIGTTTANQLHRVRNTVGGFLSAQDSVTLGTFAVTRKYDVVAGTQYAASMHGAPTSWFFYLNGRIQFFNTDGSYHSEITSGYTTLPNSTTPRELIFTVPAGAEKVAFNVRNVIDYSTTNPVTETALQICIDNIQIEAGSSATDFVPYSDGTYNLTTADFVPADSGKVIAARQGEYVYIRAGAQLSADKDVVWRLRVYHGLIYTGVYSRTGVVDIYGIRFIDKDTPVSSTIAAYNQSELIQSHGTDESANVKINGMYLAGNHGVTAFNITKVAHGKTNVDIGSIWSDGTDQWVLYYIDSVDSVTLVRKYTGASDKWSIPLNGFGSTTLTHVSGATNTGNIATFTSPTLTQFVPVLQQKVFALYVDEVEVSADGVYPGNSVVLREEYLLLNVASQQDYLIANVGAASPDYTNAAIDVQIRYFQEYSWNEWGALAIRSGHSAKQAFDRTVSDDYAGGFQLQRLALVGDSIPGMHDAIQMYVPGAPSSGGINYQAIYDITANASSLRIARTSLTDPDDPASHFSVFGSLSGTRLSGHLFGYSRDVGLGVPATRVAKADDVLFYSSSEKMYPIAIDSAAGDGTIGETNILTAFRAPYLPTDTDLTVPGVVVTMDGVTYCYVTAHQTLTNKAVALPEDLNGRAVTVLSSTGTITVHSDYVIGSEIQISTTTYGDAVMRIGG